MCPQYDTSSPKPQKAFTAAPPARDFVVPNSPVLLIVDDEAIIADTLAAIFRRHGFKVLTAYNGSDALKIALDSNPELLITDVAMPGMNGIELAICIVGADPACKVLLFSGHAASLDLTSAHLKGYDFALLAKPVHPMQMLARALECLQGSLPGTS